MPWSAPDLEPTALLSIGDCAITGETSAPIAKPIMAGAREATQRRDNKLIEWPHTADGRTEPALLLLKRSGGGERTHPTALLLFRAPRAIVANECLETQ